MKILKDFQTYLVLIYSKNLYVVRTGPSIISLNSSSIDFTKYPVDHLLYYLWYYNRGPSYPCSKVVQTPYFLWEQTHYLSRYGVNRLQWEYIM